jgi:hypothetical protein
MSVAVPGAPFHESSFLDRPIRELGLTIAGTRLEPVVTQFRAELDAVGFGALQPHLYLSNEWGVGFGTTAIAIPFYLAHPELSALHGQRTGMVEGFTPADLIRYLRHEMGHVVSYGYKLYERPEWVERFGAMSQPYVEEYRPQPFSQRFVRHLPGWYAQKHPDEDWAETFAVWMTPGSDWRGDYARQPVALAKLELCDRLCRECRAQPPLVVDAATDEDVGSLGYSLREYYDAAPLAAPELPPGIDGSLRAIFPEADGAPAQRLAGSLEEALATDVYRWTGHFPERTRLLLRELSRRMEVLQLRYAAEHEAEVIVALTTLVTALAMSHVHHGRYLP